VVSLSPIVALLILRRKHSLHAEDGLLLLLSIVLLVILYLLTNPDLINTIQSDMTEQSIGKVLLGGIAYSIIFGYFILRILRLFSTGGADKLLRYMALMLCLLNIFFVYLIFGVCFSDLLDSIATLRSGNVGNEHLLGTSYLFLILQFATNTLSYIMNIFMGFTALRLLAIMQTNRYSSEAVSKARYLSKLCVITLAITVISNISFNLLQFIFAKSIMILDISVQIPVLPIIFMLAVLLLTQLVTESKQLKDDIDMFI
jgi:hypothetical protein